MSNRDWHSYNEALVRRGELDLDSSVLEEWKRELKKANDGKVGEPYHYLESYIRLLAFVRLLFHPALQADGGFRTLPLQVRGGAAGPGLLHNRQEGQQAPDRPR
jgi:hypothetical protein